MLDEEEVLKEFNKLLNEKIDEYTSKYGTPDLNKTPPNIFIKDKVWDSEVKYHRMMMITKQKFFEALKNGESIEKYEKDLKKLWSGIDRTYMTKAIEELRLMIMARDIKNAKATQRSIKLENFWQEYEQGEKEIYQLNPERDFRTIENRYVNRHVKLYKNWSKQYGDQIVDNIENLVKRYDNMDKTIPYYSHTTGMIKCYNTISTYNSMLYNVNLLRSAWNRTAYDSRLLGNNLWYLPAHTFACPSCAEFQGYVYAEPNASIEEMQLLARYGKRGYPYVNDAIEGGVGHPNCKHNWTLFWSEDQVQEEKYNDEEWEEKYKDRQKIQSLTLQKSRLLTDRRIYKEVGREDLVDKTTAKIKHLREKIKELQ
jgi:hypothetical protein